jgi:nicotinate-nucleotide pyrophosphorylase (carboxylating)
VSLLPDLVELDIPNAVARALEEDIGSGDITAQLIPFDATAEAWIITREDCVLCGQAWVNEVFHQLGDVTLEWQVAEGAAVLKDQRLLKLQGNARQLLTGERTALNFLQTLSGTATLSRHYARLAEGAPFRVLDTRKTLPGLRLAQKYAVTVGGCSNHRLGLFDAFLIKENHIAACGGIAAAVARARQIAPEKPVEVEVENLQELAEALQARADRVMLDNLSAEDMALAVQQVQGRCELEISGNLDEQSLARLKHLAVDFVSSGALTKHVKAIDLSMRLQLQNLNPTP